MAAPRPSLLDLPDITVATLSLAIGGADAPVVDASAGVHAVRDAASARATAGEEGEDNDERGEGQVEASGGTYTSKTAPGIVFASREELAEHNRSDWHRCTIYTRSRRHTHTCTCSHILPEHSRSD